MNDGYLYILFNFRDMLFPTNFCINRATKSWQDFMSCLVSKKVIIILNVSCKFSIRLKLAQCSFVSSFGGCELAYQSIFELGRSFKMKSRIPLIFRMQSTDLHFMSQIRAGPQHSVYLMNRVAIALNGNRVLLEKLMFSQVAKKQLSFLEPKSLLRLSQRLQRFGPLFYRMWDSWI